MEGKSVSIGRHRLSVQGDELVEEHNPVLGRSQESILPLSAISSIDTTKEQSILAIVASAMWGFIGFGGLANGSAGLGLFFMFLAGACLLWWWASRSYQLVVKSPTGEISVEGSNTDRDALEGFASYLRDQRRR